MVKLKISNLDGQLLLLLVLGLGSELQDALLHEVHLGGFEEIFVFFLLNIVHLVLDCLQLLEQEIHLLIVSRALPHPSHPLARSTGRCFQLLQLFTKIRNPGFILLNLFHLVMMMLMVMIMVMMMIFSTSSWLMCLLSCSI